MTLDLYEPLEWRPEWDWRIRGGLIGLAVGDALGVPYEFLSREEVRKAYTGRMEGGGTWGQPPGTWSDDTGQALALAYGLAQGSLEAVAEELLKWYKGRAHTLGGEPFDIGGTTAKALERILAGVPPSESGVKRPSCGSLMRNLPAAIIGACLPLHEALDLAHRVSRITHSHPMAEMACGLHHAVVRAIMAGLDRREAVLYAGAVLKEYYKKMRPYRDYANLFQYLEDPRLLEEEPERGGCRVDRTLHVALWAFVSSESFQEAVEKAILVGDDTDTQGAVAGGLAGLYYGLESIPRDWLETLRGRDLIEEAASMISRYMKSSCNPPENLAKPL